MPRGGAVALPMPFALRAAGAVHTLAEHRFLDRLIRGRSWIAILGIGLIGIVFMQVSMLRMNAGIGQAVERSSVLERQNAALQAGISQLSSGERIQTVAARAGMVAPTGADGVRFLDARRLDVGRAVRGITPPSATPPVAPAVTAATPAAAAPAVAPATTTPTTPATTAPAATATTSATPAVAAAPAATPAPAPTPAAAPAARAAPPTATGAAVAGGAVAGAAG